MSAQDSGSHSDPFGMHYIMANRFYVEMESSSTISACFTECSGLSARVNYDTYFEGGVNNQQRIILGHTQFGEVTLSRGLTNDLSFVGWASRMVQVLPSDDAKVKAVRRNINILLFNQAGEMVQCWTLIGAVPVAWQTPILGAELESVAIESLTLAYEGLKVKVNTTPQGASSTGATFHNQGRGTGGFFTSS